MDRVSGRKRTPQTLYTANNVSTTVSSVLVGQTPLYTCIRDLNRYCEEQLKVTFKWPHVLGVYVGGGRVEGKCHQELVLRSSESKFWRGDANCNNQEQESQSAVVKPS